MHKIVLFTRNINSFSLINFLISKQLLKVIAVPSINDMETHNFIQILNQYKIPYFLYGEDETRNLQTLKSMDVNLALVFGFPFKVPLTIIEYFKTKIYNLHPFSLSKYKGENSIFWQIKSGEIKSFLSVQKLTENFNEGDILVQKEINIKYQDTFGTLNHIVSQLIVEVVDEFLKKLDIENLTALAKIGDIGYTKEVKDKEIQIDWKSMTSLEIYNLCRACNPIFGGAKTMLKNFQLFIVETTIVNMPNFGLEAGTIIHIGSPEGLIVSTIDGSIRVNIVSIPDGVFSGLCFVKHFNIEAGEKLKKLKDNL